PAHEAVGAAAGQDPAEPGAVLVGRAADLRVRLHPARREREEEQARVPDDRLDPWRCQHGESIGRTPAGLRARAPAAPAGPGQGETTTVPGGSEPGPGPRVAATATPVTPAATTAPAPAMTYQRRY